MEKIKESSKAKDNLKIAYFAAGCFWGVQDEFSSLKGVTKARSGYMGGHMKNPSYLFVCTGLTGHAETVEVTYDPSVITYDTLVEKFFKLHDPTQVNGQGPNIGTQYRSAIFYTSDSDKAAALKQIATLEKSKAYERKIITQLVNAKKMEFYAAEDYHQDYLKKHGMKSCHL